MRSLLAAAASLLVCAAAAPAVAQLIVTNPIEDVTVTAGTKSTMVKVKNVFAKTDESAVANPIVRFDTIKGAIDVELLQGDAPITVANFLGYVDRGDYNGTFFHRSSPGFVIQGGGYVFKDGDPAAISQGPPVVNEFKVSNTRGTLAMAKIGANPNSATDEWFFNETDDNATDGAKLDTTNGGFTVFGRVTDDDGLKVMDAIAALPVGNFGKPFDELPVIDYSQGAAVEARNLVTVRSITVLPPTSSSGALKYSVKSNTNPQLVKSTEFVGKYLTLRFKKGLTGSAVITFKAKDASGNKATTSFTVTVQ